VDRSQLRNLSAGDAAVAMRSYARRFRELLAPLVADEAARAAGSTADRGAPVDVTAPGRSGWSVLGLTDAVATHLDRLDDGLRRALETDRPVLGSLFHPPEPSGSVPSSPSTTAALGRLEGVLAGLAEHIEHRPGDDWKRAATVDGQQSSAHELLREAVAYGRNALDLLGVVVDEARRAGGPR
jgi:hypothetical protein